jgi:O-antigen/teichoic acid export membrane protein
MFLRSPKAKLIKSAIYVPLPHLRKLGGEFIWVVLGQATAVLGGIVGVRVLTNVLSPESYGELALGLTIVTLQQQLITGPIAVACSRYFAPAQESGQLAGYMRAVRQLLTAASMLILSAVAVISVGLWVLGHVQWLWLVLTAAFFGLVSGYGSALDGMQTAARQRMVVAWHQSLMQWLRFPLAWAMIVFIGSSGSMALQGYVLAAVIVLASQWMLFRRKIVRAGTLRAGHGAVESANFAEKALRYSWPFVAWGAFTWAYTASDRWALQVFGDMHSVGLYAVVYQLGYYPVVLFSDMLVQFAAPIFFHIAGYGVDNDRVERALSFNRIFLLGLITFTIIITLTAVLLHAQVFQVLVAPSYHYISSLWPFMILAGGLFACGQSVSLMFMTSGNTNILIAPKIGTSLIGIAFNIIGAYSFGLYGVIIGNIAFSFLYLVWMVYLASGFRYHRSSLRYSASK